VGRFWQPHLRECKRAAAARPDDPAVWEALADAHVEAASDLCYHPYRALPAHQAWVAAWRGRGHCRAARRAWERVIALQPTRTDAYLRASQLVDWPPRGLRQCTAILDRGLSAMPDNVELLVAQARHCSWFDRPKARQMVLRAEAASERIASMRLSEALDLLTAYPETEELCRGLWTSVVHVAQYLVWLSECVDWLERVDGPTWSPSELCTALDIWTKWYMIEHDHRLSSEWSLHHGFTVLTPEPDVDLAALRSRIAALEYPPPYVVVLGDGSLLWGETSAIEQPHGHAAQLRCAQESGVSGTATIISVIEELDVDEPYGVKLALRGILKPKGLAVNSFAVWGKANPLGLLDEAISIYGSIVDPTWFAEHYECESPEQATELWWTLADGCGTITNQDAEILHGPLLLEELAYALSYLRLAKPLGLFPASPAAAARTAEYLEYRRPRIEQARREQCNE
jgi:hypothetical protein